MGTDWSALSIILFASVAGALMAWRFGTVTGPGAIGLAVIGGTILLADGWRLLVPILVFFVTSAALSRLPYPIGAEREHRTLSQVIANGAVPMVGAMLIFMHEDANWTLRDGLAVYLGAIAAANSDTWATELGTRFGGAPRDFLNGRTLRVGTSGGVSGLGPFASVLGALAVAATYPIVSGDLCGGWIPMTLIAAAGFAGSLIDSLLGSTIQKRYRCPECGENVETRGHCGRSTKLMRGLISNNQVNWFCTATGALAAWAWLCR